MQKKGKWDGGLLEGDLIQKILVWLPVKSLLRFKSVCPSWLALIESSVSIDFHTATTFNSSSSSKFGSFILLASVDKYLPAAAGRHVREYALLMLSSSESESDSSESLSRSGGGWWWTTNSSDYIPSWEDNQPDYYDDDQVFKVEGGQQQQQQLVFKLDNLGFPKCYKVYSIFLSLTEIIGSCNGLVCLYDREDRRNEVSLWNPATRQFRILPKWITTIEDEDDDEVCVPHRNLVALGFDVETKDYKVVLVTCFQPEYHGPVAPAPVECLCRVQVYSLSTDSWRLLEGITRLPGFPLFDTIKGQVLYLNGSNCFFLAQFFHTKQRPCLPQDDRFIISFDFTKEMFTPMQLPDHHRDQELYLSCFGDKIALFTAAWYAKDHDNNDTWISYEDSKLYTGICSEVFNIWVLNEHNSSSSSSCCVNKKSWTKLHSFRIDCKRPGEWTLPRGISDDGEFAMLETRYSTGVGKKMKLYNLVTQEVKKNFLSCSMVMSKAHAYKPSLVGINNR